VANTLDLYRNGAVGFIGWLDAKRDDIQKVAASVSFLRRLHFY
jgi:hypothetical protein